VTESFLLDTPIALWLDSGDDSLRPSTRDLIDGCGGTIYLSAITACEIALLADTGRIDLDIPIEAWVKRFLARPGIAGVALGHGPASRAYQLHHLEHRDQADRLLIAKPQSSLLARWSPMMSASCVSARNMAGNTVSPLPLDLDTAPICR
jgi:PIN domain nuclease of toxin-antitoxin system